MKDHIQYALCRVQKGEELDAETAYSNYNVYVMQ